MLRDPTRDAQSTYPFKCVHFTQTSTQNLSVRLAAGHDARPSSHVENLFFGDF